MKKLIERFGKLATASFFIMAVGVIAFLLTPLLYGLWGIDSDLPGLIIVCVGLAIYVIGTIGKKKLRGWKMVVLAIIAAVLLLPTVPLFISLAYYWITGKPLGG
jgi:hypothetical protein